MDKKKLTDWFPPEVLPVRPGPYQIEDGDTLCIAFWRGDGWGFASWESGQKGVEACAGEDFRQANGSWIEDLRWRGLAEPPLTDWFDEDTPPVHEGPYEIEGDDGFRHFAYWSKDRGWGCAYNSRIGIEAAVAWAVLSKVTGSSWASSRRWRGLAVQP